MKGTMFTAAGALAISFGAMCAPTATAQDAGYGEYPCSDQFQVPWSLDAWNGTHKVAFSPFGTDNIQCVSFHGQTAAYQLDARGRKHALTPPSGVLGAVVPNLYFWDPAAY